MKTFFKCLITQVLAVSITSLQAQMSWKFINPDPYIPTIQKMHSVSGKIFALCEEGQLLETDDLLNTFTISTVNFPDPDPGITAFNFSDDQTGVFVGYSGSTEVIYRTVDKGLSCTSVYQHTGSLVGLQDAAFKNNVGYAVGLNGRILKTTDAGITWNPQNSATDKSITEIALFDENKGIAITNTRLVLQTADGGATWIKNSTSMPVPCTNLAIAEGNIVYIQCGSDLYKSSDAGQTWSFVSSFSGFEPADIRFVSADTGYCTSPYFYSQKVLRTTDGGVSWQETGLQNIDYTYFMNSSTGFFTGNIIYRTQDAGLSYQQLTKRVTSNTLSSIDFPDENTGYIGGAMGTLLKSVNGGADWETLPFPDTHGIKVVEFDTQSKGFCITQGYDQNFNFINNVYKTLDGGINWSSLKIFTNKVIRDIEVLSNDYLIAVGYENTGAYPPYISYSTDGGLNWNTGDAGITKTLNAVSMHTKTYGFIAADNYILKTLDGGQTWTNTAFSEPIRDIQVVDSLTIYAAGNKIYRSTDAGSSWMPVFSPGYVSLMALQFADFQHGYASGLDVMTFDWKFYRTADAGLTWTVIPIPYYTGEINDLFFTGTDKGFILGQDGVILASDTSHIISSPGISGIYPLILYPNPSSGEVFIKSDCLDNIQICRLSDGRLISDYRMEGRQLRVFKKGLYLISVECTGKRYIQKLIVE